MKPTVQSTIKGTDNIKITVKKEGKELISFPNLFEIKKDKIEVNTIYKTPITALDCTGDVFERKRNYRINN